MKTFFNEAHNAIIDTDPFCIAEKPKDGEMVAHINKVDSVQIYCPIDEYSRKRIEVNLSRSFILDLAEHIKKIEETTFEEKYSELPF